MAQITAALVKELREITGQDCQTALWTIWILNGTDNISTLRKGMHEYLKRHKNVADFNFADMSEGGTGATLVDLK